MSTIFKNLCIDKRSVYALVIAIEGAGGGGYVKILHVHMWQVGGVAKIYKLD